MKLKNTNIGDIFLAIGSFIVVVMIMGLVTEGVVYKSMQFFVLDDGSVALAIWKVFVLLARVLIFGTIVILVIRDIYKWLSKDKEHTFHIGDTVTFNHEEAARVIDIQPGEITMSDVTPILPSKNKSAVLSAGDTILITKDGESSLGVTVTSIDNCVIRVERNDNDNCGKFLLVFKDSPQSESIKSV